MMYLYIINEKQFNINICSKNENFGYNAALLHLLEGYRRKNCPKAWTFNSSFNKLLWKSDQTIFINIFCQSLDSFKLDIVIKSGICYVEINTSAHSIFSCTKKWNTSSPAIIKSVSYKIFKHFSLKFPRTIACLMF